RMAASAVGEEADAAQEVAVGDPRRTEDDVPRGELLHPEHVLDVLDPVLPWRLELATRRRAELSVQLAAEAAQRRGGQDRLAGAADSDREMVVRAPDSRGDGRGHGSVLDQLDPRTDRPDLLDEVVMAGTVEHDRGHVIDGAAVRLGDGLNVRPDGLEEI